MDSYEYKVIPAPEKGVKAKGIKAPAARFAYAIELAMNELGAQGWEYWRAEALPSTERSGLTGSKVTERHLLVFRRRLAAEVPMQEAAPLRAIAAPVPPAPAPAHTPEPEPEPQPVFTRRIELARESRQAALQESGLSARDPQDAQFRSHRDGD